MKKILSTLSAAAMLVAAVALVGCSGAVQANPTDIVESLDAPSVTAKAYPGFIRLTWDKVNGASSYKIYRDGALIGIVANGSRTEYIDAATQNTTLINGKSYTYDVVALAGDDYAQAQDTTASNNNTARAVYVKQAMTTVTETANVPSVAEFTEQYEDYFAKFTAEDTALKTELVTVNNTNYIKVTAPTLPEFKYGVSANIDNTPENIKSFSTHDAFEVETEDTTSFYRAITGAGTYNVTVKVIPVSPLYAAKEFAGSKAEVKGLVIDQVWSTVYNNNNGGNVEGGTRDAKATYTTATTVRIQWTPASASTVDYATTDYAVFRFDDGAYTKVAGDVAVLKAGDVNGTEVVTRKTYYIDDTVDAESHPGQYHIVLSKNGLYEDAHWGNHTGVTDVNNANIVWANNQTNLGGNVNASVAYVDAGKTARISFTPAQKSDTVAMYTVYRKLNNVTNLEKLGALKATTSTAIDATNNKVTLTDKFYVDDTIKDNTVQYTYLVYRTENNVTSQVGGNNITLNVYSVTANAQRGTLSAEARQNNNDRLSNDVYVRFTLGNIDNTFTLYRANITTNTNPLDSDYTVVTGYAFGATTATGREYVMFDSNLADGRYKYRLVETAKDKNAVATETTVTVDNTAGVSGLTLNLNSTTRNLELYDGYNNVTETWANYSYSYIVVTKTYNNISGASYYTYSDAGAVAVPAASWADITTVATSTSRSMKATVSLPLATVANTTYQVIAIKTHSATGAKTYAITSFVPSN